MVKLEKWSNRKQSHAILFCSIVLSLSLGALGSILPTQLVFATSSSTGIIEPLYGPPYSSYPCNSHTCFNWTLINATKVNHPHVPLFLVINPNSGPCLNSCSSGNPDPQWVNGIENLTKYGVTVLGYVDTCSNCDSGPGTQLSLQNVEQNVTNWYNWYGPGNTAMGGLGIKGIVYDDMFNYNTNATTHELQYFQNLTSFIHSKSLAFSIGNPGTKLPPSYVNSGAADTLNVFESNTGALPDITNDLKPDTLINDGFDKHNFSFVTGCVNNPGRDVVGNDSNYVGLLYFTTFTNPVNCNSSNTYFYISSYLDTLASYLDKGSAIINIKAIDSSNNTISGIFVNTTQSGNQIPSGNTPLPYNGTSGVKYTFTPASNYNGCTFANWKDSGSTTPARTILVNSTNATFTAVYSCSSSGIVLNNVQSTSGTVLLSPYHMTLSSFNAGTGSNRLLVVGVESNGQTVSSATFGGTALTKVVSSSTNQNAEFWYLKNPSGTGDIVVTMGGTASAVVGAYAFSGVDQTTPIPTNAINHGSGNPTISITTQYSNSWVLDSPSIYGQSTLSNPTCTQHWNIQVSSITVTGASSSKSTTSPGSVTCGWTSSVGGNGWDDVAIEVKASN